MSRNQETPDNPPRNARQLHGVLSDAGTRVLALPFSPFSAGGAVQRELDRLDARRLRDLYEATRESRDAARNTSGAGSGERSDRLEMGRRALEATLARRGLHNPRKLAADGVPLVSGKALALSENHRLDPGGHLQERRNHERGRLLSKQRRGLLGRILDTSYIASGIEVTDGDGVKINGKIRARLHGIDAPEYDETGGPESSRHLAGLLDRGAVHVHPKSRDRYGRPVVRLTVDGEDINARMVRDGYARSYKRYSREYARDERKAKRDRAGLWSGGSFRHPERHRHGESVI